LELLVSPDEPKVKGETKKVENWNALKYLNYMQHLSLVKIQSSDELI
jgi:hypothetical protein